MSSIDVTGVVGRRFRTNPSVVDILKASDESDELVVAPPPVRPKTPPRQHVKVRAELAQEMRDAVWFLTEHGRPRVTLNELLDEALEQWLRHACAQHNSGQKFPCRGSLR